jgi:hypothetical protein
MNDCMMNQVADALAETLRAIDSVGEADKWHTSPTVKRGFLVPDLMRDMPLLVVEVARYEQEPRTAQQHHASVVLIVHCVAQAQARDAEAELNRMASDVINAIAGNEKLQVAGGAESGLVLDIQVLSYSPDVEAMERYSVGVGQVICKADFYWNHGSA